MKMVRQRRAFVALLVVIVLIAALLFVRNVVAGNSGHRASTPVPAGPGVLHVEQAPWRLPQALSRSVVLPDEGRLLVAGGLAASNKTSGSMFG